MIPTLRPIDSSAPENSAQTRSEDAEVAGKAFEELLLHELFKAMRQTVPDEDGGFAQDTVYDMFDQALAEQTAGRLGVSRMLEHQLGGGGPSTVPAPAPIHTPFAIQHAAVHAKARPHHAAPAVTGDPHATGILGIQFPVGELPVTGVESSDFGYRIHPISGERKFHAGIDIAAAEGTEIRAVQRGVVTFSGNKPGYGKVIEILHDDGVTTRYAHASRLHVREGDRVDAGECVADVGQTGQATGPHLHFEARRDGQVMDPHRYLGRLRGRVALAANAEHEHSHEHQHEDTE